MNPIFSEYEKRFLLTEVLKASHVSLESLLNVIKTEHVTVKWEDIALPYGRSGRTCLEVFNNLISPPVAQVHSAPAFEPAAFAPIPRKRKLSPTDQPPLAARELKSKPPASNGDHSPAVVSTPTSGPKKRGRPSKTEIAARQAEALARGEVYPPPKPAGRKSTGSTGGVVPLASMITGEMPQEETSLATPELPDAQDPSSAPKKKRGRPSSVKNAAEESGDAPEQLVVREEDAIAASHPADTAASHENTKETKDTMVVESGSTVPDSIESTNTMVGQ